MVRGLMFVCAPITWPLAKLLDWVLGHEDVTMKRQQLKAMVQLHAEGAGACGLGSGWRRLRQYGGAMCGPRWK
jgi:metal transporter CNNM